MYNTYYYDRYYFPGQELTKHADRDACEISVSVHISTNLEGKDAKWIHSRLKPQISTLTRRRHKFLSLERREVLLLEPGDGLLYKGCERPHWRDPMPGKNKKVFGKKIEYYYHQIFFHYVLQDGERAHCAWDRAR